MPLPARTLQEGEDRDWTAVKKVEITVLALGRDSAPAAGVSELPEGVTSQVAQ